MTKINRRIEKLESRAGIGFPKIRMLVVSFDLPSQQQSAVAEAIARDEAENGPIGESEQYMFVMCGPGGHWIDTADGSRWQYPDGTLTADPAGELERAKAD